MTKVVRCLFALGLLTIGSAVFANDVLVDPGSAAPPLSVKKWFKGTPISALLPDKTYVVEFWATWCGPCVESIPHLTEIAKKNPDVTFVGVSVWEEEDDSKIGKFVQEMGDKMDYHVGYSGNQDGMAKSWMEASAQRGIPTAFIVKNSKIQWVGHPMELEKPLAEVKAGTFDLETFKAKFDAAAIKTRKDEALQAQLQKVSELYSSGHAAQAKSKLAELVSANPSIAGEAESIRFGWLALEDPKAWEAKATSLANSSDQSQVGMVLSFALRHTQSKADLALGRKAMKIALTATGGKNLTVLLYAHSFYMETNEYPKSLDALNQAIELQHGLKTKNPELEESLTKMKAELIEKMK